MRLLNITPWYHLAAFCTGISFYNFEPDRIKQQIVPPCTVEACADMVWPTV